MSDPSPQGVELTFTNASSISEARTCTRYNYRCAFFGQIDVETGLTGVSCATPHGTEGILDVLEPVSPQWCLFLCMELPGEENWHHFLKSFSQGMAHRNGTRHLFRPARALGSLLVFRKSLVSGASALSSGQGASLWEASSCERPISALAWLKLKHQNSDDEVLWVPPSGGELL